MRLSSWFQGRGKKRAFRGKDRLRHFLRLLGSITWSRSFHNGKADLHKTEITRPPAHVVQPGDEFILIERRVWQRLQGRLRSMSAPSPIWLLAAGAFFSAVLTSPFGGTGLVFAVAALICGLAHFAIDRSHQILRKDIADEMRSHEPPRRKEP